MAGVNKVILVGNMGADPELRHTSSGQAVCNLRLACSESFKDRDGQRQERTEWVSVTVWGPQGESCGQYLSKGRQVYVEGRLQTREYEDRDGNKRKATDVVATSVVFLAGGGDRDGSHGSDGGGARSGGSRSSAGASGGKPSGGRPLGGGWGGGWGGSKDKQTPSGGAKSSGGAGWGSDGPKGGDDPIPF